MSPCHIAAKVECGGFVYAQNEREEGGVLLLSQECLNTSLCLQPALKCVCARVCVRLCGVEGGCV